jgi:hypothetical protein
LTPPDRVGARRNHIGKNPLRLWRGRLLIAIDGRMAAGFSMGALSLHAAQYAPRERVSPQPSTPRRSVITVSTIVGPPHRLHAIAMSRLRSPFSTANINRRFERIKNNNDALIAETVQNLGGLQVIGPGHSSLDDLLNQCADQAKELGVLRPVSIADQKVTDFHPRCLSAGCLVRFVKNLRGAHSVVQNK